MLIGQLLREYSFCALEALVRSSARRPLCVSTAFGDDTLAYFSERLDPSVTRGALAAILRQAKRNKAFDDSRFIGLALDGTTVGRCGEWGCPLCRPFRNANKEVIGYRHHLVMISMVGVGMSLPFDVEPYGPGDSEYAAGQRLLRRAVAQVWAQFADYVVVDGEFATAPFLHAVGESGLHVVARLKENLPELLHARKNVSARNRRTVVSAMGKTASNCGRRTISILGKPSIGKPFGSCAIVSTNPAVRSWRHTGSPISRPDESLAVPSIAWPRASGKSRIKDLMTPRVVTEHICHHHANSLLVGWLVTILALTIERLYRLRLHRGTHPIRTAIELMRCLWLSLSQQHRLVDSS
jgi:hypothetical protein